MRGRLLGGYITNLILDHLLRFLIGQFAPINLFSFMGQNRRTNKISNIVNILRLLLKIILTQLTKCTVEKPLEI